MNLQENIRRILREERKLSNFLRRRLEMLDYENEYPYDKVYEFLLNYFHDKIKDRYDTFFGNKINESVDKSEDKKLKLVTKMIHEFFDEVSFIKIKKYENKPLIRVYFDNDEYAGNEESYFAEQIQDKIYKGY